MTALVAGPGELATPPLWQSRVHAAIAAGEGSLQNLKASLETSEPSLLHARAEAAWILSDIGPTVASSHGEALCALLKDPDAAVRLAACEALGHLGVEARPFVEALEAALNDPEASVWRKAAWALGCSGPAAVPCAGRLASLIGARRAATWLHAAEALKCMGFIGADALATKLEDDDPLVRRRVALTLGSLKGTAAIHLTNLTLMLQDSDAGVRRAVAETVTSVSESSVKDPGHLPGWRNDLATSASSSPDRDKAEASAPTLNATAMEVWQSGLMASDADRRERTVKQLARLGAGAGTYLDSLARLLSDPHPKVRRTVLWAFGQLGLMAASYAEGISQCFADPDPDVRQAGELALRRIGLVGEGAIVDRLTDSDPQVRSRAAQALSRLGGKAGIYAPAISEALQDEDRVVRASVAHSLESLGVEALPYAAGLARCLTDPSAAVRSSGVAALGAIGVAASDFAGQMAERLRDDNDTVQFAASLALCRLGPEAAAPYVSELAALLNHSNVEVSLSTLQGIGLLGETAAAAVAPIERRLSAAEDRIRSTAAWALGQIGEAASVAVPSLRAVLAHDVSADVRLQAVEAIGLIGPAAKESAPEVFQALRDEDPCVRRSAPAALARLGDSASAEVDLLIDQLCDSSIDVWSEAAWTLEGMAEVGSPILAKLLSADRAILRVRSTVVLANMTMHHPNYLPVLAEQLEDPDVGVRSLAARAVGGMGAIARAFCPALARRLVQDGGEVKHRAAEGLWSILSEVLKKDFQAKERSRMTGSVEELRRGGELGATTLASRLGADDREYWRSAANALMEMGAVGAAALAKLLLPAERNVTVRTRAAWALGEMAQAALPHADILAACLVDGEPEVRDSAAWALLRLSSVHALQASTTSEGLKGDANIWQKAILPLRELGASGTGVLASRACDDNLEVQAIASDALQLTGDFGAAALASMLGSRDEEVRRRAVMLLGRMGAVSAPYSGMIMRLLTDRQLVVQRSSAAALGQIGPSAAQHMGRLLLKLDSEDAILRGNALESLKDLGTVLHPHLDVIAACLEDTDARVRRLALETFFTSGRLGLMFLEAIAARLADGHAEVRATAAEALGRFGEAAAGCALSLAAALGDSDYLVRRKATWAFSQIGQAACLPFLGSIARLLADPSTSVRGEAVECLRSFGSLGVPHVVEFLRADDAQLRRCAAEALGRLPAEQTEHAEALAACLQDDDVGVRMAAADSLRRLALNEGINAQELRWSTSSLEAIAAHSGSHFEAGSIHNVENQGHEDAGPVGLHDGEAIAKQAGKLALAASRHEPDPTVRASAAWALAEIGDAAESAASELTLTFRDDGDDWMMAADKLLLMGDAGARAVARRLHDVDPAVRRRAVLTLGRQPRWAHLYAGALEELTFDRDAGVRRTVQMALEEAGIGVGSFPEL